MKRILLLVILLAVFAGVYSQSLEDAKKDIYYQRHISAENVLTNYLKQYPTSAEAWLLLTKTYLLQGELQNAAGMLASATASLTEDPYFLIAKGSICLAEDKKDSSRWYFDKAINITKGKNAEVLTAVADMETISDNGDMPFALEIIQKAMKKSKHTAQLHVIAGNAYRNLHNGGEAFRSYTTAIQKEKSLAEAYYFLGEIFLSQKNPDLYLSYFNKAIEADSYYGPAYYQLYIYSVYTKPDPKKAMKYFQEYAKVSDKTIRMDYAYTDLLYLNKDYKQAIANAKELIDKESTKVQPRIHKLIAYSYAESKDSASAVDYMKKYFIYEEDSNIIAQDFELMAKLYADTDGNTDSAMKYYQRAAIASNDSVALYKYYKDLATLATVNKNYEAQSKWLGLYYSSNDKASNVDLFNWGIAAYRSNNYLLADSVFGLYTVKYPDQGFGFYWRARTNAVVDSGMTAGLAIPYYNKLIEMINTDSLSTADKKWLVEAYAYIAAYEANIQKNYDKAIEYFDKILEIDPENANAKKYIPILEASAQKREDSN